MRPVALEIRNFRGWHQGNVPLDRDMTLLVGENRRGKSSTLNAIEWCLFGRDIEKKACGIDERVDWQMSHRNSIGGPTEVTLVLARSDGRVRVTRRRDRLDETFRVESSAGVREGFAAQQQLSKLGIPDWTTWRRAFCQHQETVRRRLTDARDRSALLADLLGLGEYDALHRTLKAVHPAAMLRQLEDGLDRFDHDLRVWIARPESELLECEQRLEALGLARTTLSPHTAEEICGRMLARARRLVEGLDLAAEIPEHEEALDLPSVRDWAERWPETLRAGSRITVRLQELQRRRGALQAELARLAPLEASWRKVSDRMRAEAARDGDRATRQRLLEEAEGERARLERELFVQDRGRALLKEARELLRASGSDTCPVCASRVPDLASEIERHLTADVARTFEQIEQKHADANERCEHLRRSREEWRRLEQEGHGAREQLDDARRRLQALLPPACLEGADLLQEGQAAAEHLDREIEHCERALADRDRELDEHRRDLDRLRELARWQAAAGRCERGADPTRTPAWTAMQRALDRAAGFAVDVEALASLARESQSELSDQREREINGTLSEFLECITGEPDLAVKVRVKRTARGLSYDLEDGSGTRVLATLNQATLNAVSLALLFAQAEARARGGAFAWVVLDDPAQSLDAAHQEGLARAIARVARTCPVVVATTPGPLADALRDRVSIPRRILRLGRWERRGGARIAEEETR